jgi:hypothetical protein
MCSDRCLHEMVPDWCSICLGLDDSQIPGPEDADNSLEGLE